MNQLNFREKLEDKEFVKNSLKAIREKIKSINADIYFSLNPIVDIDNGQVLINIIKRFSLPLEYRIVLSCIEIRTGKELEIVSDNISEDELLMTYDILVEYHRNNEVDLSKWTNVTFVQLDTIDGCEIDTHRNIAYYK